MNPTAEVVRPVTPVAVGGIFGRPWRPREFLEKEAVFSWLLLTPPLLFLLLFLGYPFFYGIWLSFF
jgi:hypothetical protein